MKEIEDIVEGKIQVFISTGKLAQNYENHIYEKHDNFNSIIELFLMIKCFLRPQHPG
jgi:hypothetical protein